MREYYSEDPLEDQKYKKLYGMLHGAKARAAEKEREFNLTVEYLVTLYVDICPVLKVPLAWDNQGKINPYSPSLDRINNLMGYTIGNVQIISYKANALKKHFLLEEMEMVRKYMQEAVTAPLKLTGDMYSESPNFSDDIKRTVRNRLRKGCSVVEIAFEHELPLSQIVQYVNSLPD